MDASRLEKGYWYHSIAVTRDDGTAMVTPGEYDHRPYLSKYGFPASLAGKSVMDVGAADGFFSFEFERRGAASVVAVDIPAYPDVPFHEVAAFGEGVTRGVSRFDLARSMLRSAVEHRDVSVYDLTPEAHGTYDLVFCGSLLLHLTDPLRAVQGLRQVAGDRLIIATAYYHEPMLGLYERALAAGDAPAQAEDGRAVRRARQDRDGRHLLAADEGRAVRHRDPQRLPRCAHRLDVQA